MRTGLDHAPLADLLRWHRDLRDLLDRLDAFPSSEWRRWNWQRLDDAEGRVRLELARRHGLCEGARQWGQQRHLVG